MHLPDSNEVKDFAQTSSFIAYVATETVNDYKLLNQALQWSLHDNNIIAFILTSPVIQQSF